MQRSLASRGAEFGAPVGLSAVAPSILIIGNDIGAAEGVRDCGLRGGHRVQEARDVITALGVLDAAPDIGIAFVDGGSPGFDGLALIERLRRTHRGVACVLVARNPSADEVVRAMRLQVADVVTAPEDGAQLDRALGRALAAREDAGADLASASPEGFNSDVLEQAYRHGLALIETVRTLREDSVPVRVKPFASGPRAVPAPVAPVPSAVADAPNDHLSILQAIQRKRAARGKFFPKGLFEDPCWDMLLDLMINHLQGRRISVSSLCIASGVAQTTALRRIADLHDRGLVRRIADDKDGRRVFIELTEAGAAAMKRYVDSVGVAG
ncbi:response regulator transcription factor [Azospirillum rugosum]|uniref:CheY-like chemotaxis protein n=1 Tax=Azospirillum rugosum TaxID=416170 RepID=A0ABS4SCW1_9PROT|nr:response regulator transcription factor [Azospirillum rugosum]MBP2290322.1 CheY-like chemotaxis protein [Azospirillum rugosum]MDQ0527798.1 CheY-like chemotaxis protein [Azospirillum rugosum]